MVFNLLTVTIATLYALVDGAVQANRIWFDLAAESVRGA